MLLLLVPALHWLATGGPTVWITNTVRVRADVPLLFASKFIRDARNLAQYEQKVTGVATEPGGFTIWGHWFGLPWTKSFAMKLGRDGGFHSVVKEPVGSAHVPSLCRFRGSGGFRLEPCAPPHPAITVWASWASGAGAGVGAVRRTGKVQVPPTNIIHYERYGWPLAFPLIVLIGPVWSRWHRRGMECEMQIIKATCERMFESLDSDVGPADAGPEAFLAVNWAGWKYSPADFLKEGAANLLCRPYSARHPDLADDEVDKDALY